MGYLLEALNQPAQAFHYGKNKTAWLLVALTIFINTVFEPVLSYIANGFTGINYLNMLLITLYGIVTYLAICIIFWFVCKCLGSRALLRDYLNTWGFTYFPTILCSIIVAVTEAYFYLFWNSTLWGMFFSIFFVGILLWKTVLYVIYLREVAKLRRGSLAAAFIIIGIFILAIAYLDGFLGLKTPIL